ncbi:MAG: EAL domain-containing protein [Actinomycetes bacterium]
MTAAAWHPQQQRSIADHRLKTTWVDIGLAVALTVVLALFAATFLQSAHGTSIILPSGGVVAGVLILLPTSRWWPYVVIGLCGQGAYYLLIGHLSVSTTIARTTADAIALLGYAAIIRRYRQPKSGLGADFLLVLVSAALAAAIREIPIMAVGFFEDTPEALNQRIVGLEAYCGTVIGILVGSAIVLGLARWRETRPWSGWTFYLDLLLLFAIAVAVVATFFTPLGAVIPGSRYFIVALLLISAARLPITFTSLVTGLATLSIASAATRGTGAFHRDGPASTADVLDAQAYLLVVTLAVLLLAATIDRRRTAEQVSKQSADLLQGMFDGSPVPSAWVRIDGDRRIAVRRANPAFTTLLGIPDSQTTGGYLDAFLTVSGQPLTSDLLVGSDLQCTLPDARTVWLRPSLSSFGDTDREPGMAPDLQAVSMNAVTTADSENPDNTILVLQDVSASRTFDEIMRRQSQRDPLTGLPNRAALLERLDRRVPGDRHTTVAVTLLNIDGLREINDIFGYAVGDQVLTSISSRLTANAHESDFIARIGGDEFVVITGQIEGSEDHDTHAKSLLESISAPQSVAGQSIVITASAGIASSSDAGETESDILRRADAALAGVKANSRNSVGHFTDDRSRRANSRFDLESKLRRAIATQSLVCHFQTIVDMSSGKVVSAETLVRMAEPDGSLIPPLLFIPLARELGLLGALTEQVTRVACQEAARWRAAGHPLRVAVNAPPSWLTDQAPGFLGDLLAAHQLPQGTLTLEITEDEAMDLREEQLAVLAELRELGVRLAIDDFGTGYSGLSSFLAVPSDVIKIDRSFVASMGKSRDDLDMLQSILLLIRRFGKKSVAEGVETPAQYAALSAMGCDLAQGFLISMPVPTTDVVTTGFTPPDGTATGHGAGSAP